MPTIAEETGHANEERAADAETALLAYAGTQSSDEKTYLKEEGHETVIADLLCDLMHLAHRQGLNFGPMAERAADHFLYETGNDAYRAAWWKS